MAIHRPCFEYLLISVKWGKDGNECTVDLRFVSQAPVVQTLDSAIQWIRITEINYAIPWIVIYPVDSAIQRFNNRDQMMTFSRYRRKI